MSAFAKLSLLNHWASATITATSTLSGYSADNVKDATRPMLPWRSNNVITDSDLRADHGSSKLVELVVFANCNFATAHFQAHASNSWGAPTYASGAQTVARNPWNDRYTHAIVPGSPPNLRWNRLFIPGQTPVDGAAYFEVGYVWAGAIVDIPDGLFEYGSIKLETVRPRKDTRSELGESLSRLRTGPPFTRLHASRMALSDDGALEGQLTVGELRDWADLERRWWDAPSGAGAFYLNEGLSSEAWVMRMLEQDPWALEEMPKSTSALTLEEFIAGV